VKRQYSDQSSFIGHQAIIYPFYEPYASQAAKNASSQYAKYAVCDYLGGAQLMTAISGFDPVR
jgi:hypothetical protein